MTDAVEAVARTPACEAGYRDDATIGGGCNEPMWKKFSYAATAVIKTLTALGWLPPEAVERLLKHQHDIIGAQAASLEKAELEVERLSAAIPAIERTAMERAAAACDEMGAAENRNWGLSRGAQNYFRARNAILALAPSNSTWREVKEGWDVTPKEPTPEMTSAGIESDDKRTGGETCNHIFRHMIAARPRP